MPTHSLVLLPEGITAPRLRRCNSGPLHLTLFFYTSFLCYQVFQSSLRQRPAGWIFPPQQFRPPLSQDFRFSFFCMPFTPALPHFNAVVHELLLCTSFGRCHILHFSFSAYRLQRARWLPFFLSLRHLLLGRCFANMFPDQVVPSKTLLRLEEAQCAPRSSLLEVRSSIPSRILPIPCLLIHGDCTCLTTMSSLNSSAVRFTCSPSCFKKFVHASANLSCELLVSPRNTLLCRGVKWT